MVTDQGIYKAADTVYESLAVPRRRKTAPNLIGVSTILCIHLLLNYQLHSNFLQFLIRSTYISHFLGVSA